MRIISYPPEEEIERVCPYCKCKFAYTQSDTDYKRGVGGYMIYVNCPCCKKEINVDYTPDPKPIYQQEFYYGVGPTC